MSSGLFHLLLFGFFPFGQLVIFRYVALRAPEEVHHDLELSLLPVVIEVLENIVLEEVSEFLGAGHETLAYHNTHQVDHNCLWPTYDKPKI